MGRCADASAELLCKPALGTRGEGIDRFKRCYASVAAGLAAQTHDVLLQPWLARVATDGEICCVFVNEVLLHVVHKSAHHWGAHKPVVGVDGTCHEPAILALGHPVVRLAAADCEAQVQTAKRALAHVHERVNASDSAGGCLYLCRVDLLPGDDADGGWLISEVEVGWPELFLRAQPLAVPAVAAALSRHWPPEFAGTGPAAGPKQCQSLFPTSLPRGVERGKVGTK